MTQETSIIDFEKGLKVVARSGYTSWYGTIVDVTKTTVRVKFGDGTEERFSRNSRFKIGGDETRYTRPYLCTVAEAKHKDAEYKAATERARRSLASSGFCPPSLTQK